MGGAIEGVSGSAPVSDSGYVDSYGYQSYKDESDKNSWWQRDGDGWHRYTVGDNGKVTMAPFDEAKSNQLDQQWNDSHNDAEDIKASTISQKWLSSEGTAAIQLRPTPDNNGPWSKPEVNSGEIGGIKTSSKLLKLDSTSLDSGSMTGTDKQVYDFLVGKGLSRAGALAILANLKQESGLDPNALGDSGQSYGIAQWRFDRRSELEAKPGYNTVQGQLEHLWDTLQSGEFSKLRSAFMDPNRDPAELTRLWCTDYEKAEAPHMEGRIKYLNELLAQF